MNGSYQSSPPNLVGEMGVLETWEVMQSDPNSELIDVRTSAEWSFVGRCDLDKISKSPIMVEWLRYPGGEVVAEFSENLKRELEKRNRRKDVKLFFICRSGQRSLAAAKVMAAEGYTNCINVADGFEGPLGPDQHRGGVSGWKVEGLPWVQS